LRQAGFWRGILAELEAGHHVFLAWVASATEHSPGTRGAKMWLSASGARQGTIGGGIMEKKLEERAKVLLASPPESFFERRTLHHSREAAGERSGMICAGSQENLALLLRPEKDRAAVAEVVAALEADTPGYLVLSSRGVEHSNESSHPPPPSPRRRPGPSPQSPSESEYREPLQNLRRIAIFGGGHCGQALARQMSLLGYDVLLLETRAAVLPADAASLGEGVEVRVVDDFSQAGAGVTRPELTAAVVMTTDFPNDVRALEGALRQPFPFLGLMGSPAKIAEIRNRLLSLGCGEEDLERLVAPVGLQIGSRTPPEIAVSIAAQVLAVREGTLSRSP
jgi:xanthine dehydrogenase accessory factor